MRALTWHGRHDVRVETVPDPEIVNPHDAVLKVTSTAICGSDLHLYDGYVPTMMKGDILGHEFMGEVVEVGSEVRTLNVGDRVIVPFPISCGRCFYCQQQLWSLCDNTNPNAWMVEANGDVVQDEYELEPYLYLRAIRLGYRTTEVPVTKVYPPKALGQTKMRPVVGWWSILRPLVYVGLGLRR